MRSRLLSLRADIAARTERVKLKMAEPLVQDDDVRMLALLLLESSCHLCRFCGEFSTRPWPRLKCHVGRERAHALYNATRSAAGFN